MGKRVFALFFLLLLAGSLPLHAAEPGSGRCLGGHCFIVPVHQTNPFIATQFGFVQGLMTVSSTGVTLPDGSEFDLSMLGVREEFDFNLAWSESLGLFAKAGGFAMTGTNADSALLIGGQGEFSGELGLVSRLFAASSTLISSRISIAKGKNLMVQPLAMVTELQNTGKVNPGAMFSDANSWSFTPGVSLAQALGKSLGVIASAWWTYNKPEGADATQTTFLGVSADLDFMKAMQFPLAFSGEFAMEFPEEGEGNKTMGGGAYYSGRQDLQLGMFISTTMFPKNALFVNGIDNLYGQLMMRYFF